MSEKKCGFGFYTSNQASRLCKYLAGPYSGKEFIGVVVHDGVPSEILADLCREHKIQLHTVDYQALLLSGKDKNAYISQLLLTQLLAHEVDYCFCFGSRLLVGELLERYALRIINFHPALLPAFPGRKSIDQALKYGALLLGNTAHFIDAGMDTGPIVMQSTLPAAAFHGYDSVLDLQLPMLQQLMSWLQAGRVQVKDGKVHVLDAQYRQRDFIPNLEV